MKHCWIRNDLASSYWQRKYSGTRGTLMNIVAYGDFRTFDRKILSLNSLHCDPLRIDESGSMWYGRDGSPCTTSCTRSECVAQRLDLRWWFMATQPIVCMKTSLYSYKEFAEPFDYVPAKLMSIARQNVIIDGGQCCGYPAEKLSQQCYDKITMTISDGQPKAMPIIRAIRRKADIQAAIKGMNAPGTPHYTLPSDRTKDVIKEIMARKDIDISNLKILKTNY